MVVGDYKENEMKEDHPDMMTDFGWFVLIVVTICAIAVGAFWLWIR